jgi:hypothetical protein
MYISNNHGYIMDDIETRDAIEKLMWGDRVEDVDMSDVMKTADKDTVTKLLLMVFRAFGRQETMIARGQIDEYLTNLTKKYLEDKS